MKQKFNCLASLFSIAVSMSLFPACTAQIKSFSVVPRHICRGERVEVQWDVLGSPSIEATPPNSVITNGPVASEGHATITPSATTQLRLQVARLIGSSTTSTQEIEVVTDGQESEVMTASLSDAKASPGCGDGKVWATIHAERFASNVRVTRVASHPGDRRIYEVMHSGVNTEVAPDKPSTAFAGTPIAGDWALTVPLAADQTCESIPHNLVIDVTTQCAEELP
jgi:hypothetical protein